MEKGVRKRPLSDELIDLHISVVPPECWIQRLNYASPKVIDETFSAGFIRVHPDRTISSLRTVISEQIGDHLFPEKYVFLKHVGRCLALVNDKQEQQLKAKNFVPPRNTLPELFILPTQPSSYSHQSLPPTKLASGENNNRRNSVKGTRISNNYGYGDSERESNSSHSKSTEHRVPKYDPYEHEKMRRQPSGSLLKSTDTGQFYHDSRTLGERFVSGQSVMGKHALTSKTSRSNTPNLRSSVHDTNAKHVATHEEKSRRVSSSKEEHDHVNTQRRYKRSGSDDNTPLPDSGIVVEQHTPDNKGRNRRHEQMIRDPENIQFYQHSSPDSQPHQDVAPYYSHHKPSTDPSGLPVNDQFHHSPHGHPPRQYNVENENMLHPHHYSNHEENNGASPSIFTEVASDEGSNGHLLHNQRKVNMGDDDQRSNPNHNAKSTNPSILHDDNPHLLTDADDDDSASFSDPRYESDVRKVQYVTNPDSGFNDRSHDSDEENGFFQERSGTVQQQHQHALSNDRHSFIKGAADDRFDDSKMSYRQVLESRPEHITNSHDIDRLSPGWHTDVASGSGSQYSVRDSDNGSLVDHYQPPRITSQSKFYDEGSGLIRASREQHDSHEFVNSHEGVKESEKQGLGGLHTPRTSTGEDPDAKKARSVFETSNGEQENLTGKNTKDRFHEENVSNNNDGPNVEMVAGFGNSTETSEPSKTHSRFSEVHDAPTNTQPEELDPLGRPFLTTSGRQQHENEKREENSFHSSNFRIQRSGNQNEASFGDDTPHDPGQGNPIMKMFPSTNTSQDLQHENEKLRSIASDPKEVDQFSTKNASDAKDKENLPNRGHPDGMPMVFAAHTDAEQMQISNENGSKPVYNAEKPVRVGTPHSEHEITGFATQEMEFSHANKSASNDQEFGRPVHNFASSDQSVPQILQKKKDMAINDSAKSRSSPMQEDHSRSSSAEKRNLLLQKQRLWNELLRMKENRAFSEKQRQELVKRAKNTSVQINNKRGAGRDMWKRRYFNEKKKTATLSELSERLHQQHDSFRKKWPTHQAAVLTHPRDKRTSIITRPDERPSIKSNSKIQASKTLQSIEDLKKKLNAAKIRLTGEVKLRHEAEQELKNMKQGLLNKKIQSHVAFRKMNKYRSNVYYSPSGRNKNMGFQSQLR